MAERSVIVRLIAENGSFDAAMGNSAKKVGDIGTSADQASKLAKNAMGEIKAAASTILGAAALKSGQDLINLQQSAQIAFTAIAGNAQAASAQIQQIYQWDQSNPVPFQNALAAGQKLAAFGVDLKDVVPTLQAIADATGVVGGSADTFDRIALALGQVQTKGKLSAEEMLQLAESGLPAWKILADQLGITIPQAMKLTQQGAIDADTALTALRDGIEKKFPGAAQNMKNTTLGAWQSLKAGIRDGAKDILDPLQGIAQQAFVTGGAFARDFGLGVANTIHLITATISPATSLVSGFLNLFGGASTPMLAATAATIGVSRSSDTLQRSWSSLRSTGTGLAGDVRSLAQVWGLAGQETSNFRERLSLTWQTANVGRESLTSLRAAGSNLLGFFGGPLGIAIVGATTLMTAWGDAQNQAKQQEIAHEAQLSALKDTLDKVSGALTAATTAKISQDWSKPGGIVDQMKQLGINTHLAMQAAIDGGPALDAFKKQLHDGALAAIEQSDAYKQIQEQGGPAAEAAEKVASAIANGQIDITSASNVNPLTTSDLWSALATKLGDAASAYAQVGHAVVGTNSDIATSAQETRQAFDLVARSVATTAGVSGDKLVPALEAAKESGGSVEKALSDAGFTADETGKIISGLGDYVMNTGQGFHVMAGAADGASGALSTVAGSAKDAAAAIKAAQDSMAELNSKVNSVYAGLLQQAKDLRDSVQSSVSGFVSPLQAWSDAVDAVNVKAKRVAVSDNPAVKAAEAAVKAAQKQKDATTKSADAERDAAIKSAQTIRDAVVAKAKADQDAVRSAQQAAQKRVDAARSEASELKKLSDQRKKDAEDAENTLNAAVFKLQSAKKEVETAKLARDSATDPRTRAQWQLAYNSALEDEATARKGLSTAQTDYNAKSKSATDTQQRAQKAAADQKSAEADLAAAKDRAATVSEQATARQQAADKALADARDKANTRYQKAVDAATAHLDALRDKQDQVRESAQNMADQAAGAVSGMVEKAKPSFAQWLQQLSDQKQAQQEWADNLRTLSKKLPGDVVSYLAGLGPGAADMIAQMNSQSVGELGKAVPLIRAAMPDWSAAVTNGILASIPGSQAAMAGMGDDAIQSLIDHLNSGKEPTRQVLNDLGYDLATDAAGNPIIFPIGVDTTAADAYLSSWLTQQTHALSAALGNTSYSSGGGVGGYASGGQVSDGWAWFGENGPELGYKSGSSMTMYSAPQSAAMIQPAPDSGPRVVINMPVVSHNAVAEPTSVTIRRGLDSVASVVSAL